MKTPCLLSSMVALAALAAPACKTTTPLYCETHEDCADDPGRTFCDVEGEYSASEGIGRTCIPDPFPDAGVDPDGGNDAGDEACGDDTCPLGCDDSGTSCLKLDPSNGLAPYLDMAAEVAKLELPAGVTIDTDQGAAIDADGNVIELSTDLVPAPEGGAPIRVVWASEVTLRDTNVIGSPALAIVASGPIQVLGTVSLTPEDLDLPVPGTMDCAPEPVSCDGGSAGGSFGSFGGRGGDADFDLGGTPLSTAGNEALVPLRGGCQGGSNYSVQSSFTLKSFGGRAGGAIQLSSASRILIGVGAAPGLLVANGEGGRHQPYIAEQRLRGCGGGGGGSGGAVLLEAPELRLSATSRISTVGGGGSCWNATGETASGETMFAEGGTTIAAGSGDGGRGAYGSQPAEDGESGMMPNETQNAYGGGGGGGGGRIRINTLSGEFDSGGTISPSPSVGSLATR